MLCWGIAPIFGKLGLYQVEPAAVLCLRTLMAATLVLGYLAGTKTFFQLGQIPLGLWFFIGAEAILATLVGDLAYFAALKYGNINNVTLIMSTSPLVTIILSAIFLGESITKFQLVGALMIVGGLICIGLEPG